MSPGAAQEAGREPTVGAGASPSGAITADGGSGTRKFATVILMVAAVVIADQTTKMWVARSFELHQSVAIFPSWFHLTYVRNTGAAFSILAGRSAAFRVPFFVVASLVAGAAIVSFVRRTPADARGVLIACGSVLGGALGNLIDRVAHGEVIDFVDLHWRGIHWPAFNVADACISLGVVALLLHSFFAGEPDRPAETTGRTSRV
jgi:signal peptidase II